jgi:hypothetical protein
VSDALSKTLDNLAERYMYENKYSEAVAAYREALSIKESVLPPDHPEIIDGLQKLASLYESHGDRSMAAELRRRALAIRNHTSGSAQGSIAACEPLSPGRMGTTGGASALDREPAAGRDFPDGYRPSARRSQGAERDQGGAGPSTVLETQSRESSAELAAPEPDRSSTDGMKAPRMISGAEPQRQSVH